MKPKHIISALLCVLCLFSFLLPAASAEEDDWDDCMADYLAQHGLQPADVNAGYLNLVTGEVHYLNPDSYRLAGSMYKVTSNMLYLDMVANGEMTMDTYIAGFPYSTILRETIVHSNNEMAQALWINYGTWVEYRNACAPYYGIEDVSTVDRSYYAENYLTPRQILEELRQLYAEKDGRYTELFSYLLEAEPEGYFCAQPQNFPVAHKYGWMEADGNLYINDSAVILTDEPIAIVLFTLNPSGYDVLLADYCRAMIDYAQTHLQVSTEPSTAQAAQSVHRAQHEDALSQTLAALNAAVEQSSSEHAEALRYVQWNLLVSAGITVLLLVTVVLLRAAHRLRARWGLAAVLAAALLLSFAAAAPLLRTVSFSAPSAEERVRSFFDAVCAEDEDAAASCLAGYRDLGWDFAPETQSAKRMKEALLQHRSYRILDSRTVGTTAFAAAVYRTVDLKLVALALEDQVSETASSLIEELPREEIYAEDGSYRSDFTDRVYLRALETLLADAERFETDYPLLLTMQLADGQWQIDASAALFAALSGEAAE